MHHLMPQYVSVPPRIQIQIWDILPICPSNWGKGLIINMTTYIGSWSASPKSFGVLTSRNKGELAKHSIFFSFLCLSDFDILSCSCSGGISEIKEALQEILNSWKEALNGARCSFEEILLSLYLTLFHNKLPLMSPHVLCKTKWI